MSESNDSRYGNHSTPPIVRFKLTTTLSPGGSASCKEDRYSDRVDDYRDMVRVRTVYDPHYRFFGLSGEYGWSRRMPDSHHWEVISMEGCLMRHGKVETSPITAGGTGTVKIQYNDEGTETDSDASVAVKDIGTSDHAVDDVVQICYEPKSRKWYILISGSGGGSDSTKWITVEGSPSIDDGMPIAESGLCVWDAKITTIEAAAETFCEGEDRFTKSTDVWVMVVDLLNGSGSSTPRLYKGDRFLAKLVGVYTLGEDDTRPLYAIRKGTQADIVSVVGDSPGDATGAPATPSAAGLWDGLTYYVTVGATTFVGGATPYTAGPPCWILAPDNPNGSIDAAARLKKGDRYPGIFLGQFDHEGDVRPLYAIRLTRKDPRPPANFYNPGVYNNSSTAGYATNEWRANNQGSLRYYSTMGDLAESAVELLTPAAYLDPTIKVLEGGLWRIDWSWTIDRAGVWSASPASEPENIMGETYTDSGGDTVVARGYQTYGFGAYGFMLVTAPGGSPGSLSGSGELRTYVPYLSGTSSDGMYQDQTSFLLELDADSELTFILSQWTYFGANFGAKVLASNVILQKVGPKG